MERVGGEHEGQTTDIKKVAAASFVGTTIEWYDFFLYGTAAALVFNKLFFPNVSPAIGTLAAFATFGVGFFARPVGGIVFGHYGDRIGRKTMLVITLTIMGLATFFIGLLPSYDSIGLLAPLLLVVLRLLQGFGVGGEWGGAVLMAVEHAPPNRRGFFGSWAQLGVPMGLLLSTVIFRIFSGITTEDQFLAWGWRVPFLLSIILVGVGLYVRLAILESPAFRQVQETQTEAQMPIIEVLRTYPKNVLLAMGMRISENGAFYIFTVFVLSYVTEELGLSEDAALNGVILSAVIGLGAILFWGWLSDRVGRRPIYLIGAVFSLLFAFPFFWILNMKSVALIWLAIVLAVNIGHDAMYGPQAAYFSELFGTRVRYSGASLGYQLASVLAGGLSPFIAAALLNWAGGAAWPVALYMAFMALISVVAVLLARETYRGDIMEEQPEERRLIGEEPG